MSVIIRMLVIIIIMVVEVIMMIAIVISVRVMVMVLFTDAILHNLMPDAPESITRGSV